MLREPVPAAWILRANDIAMATRMYLPTGELRPAPAAADHDETKFALSRACISDALFTADPLEAELQELKPSQLRRRAMEAGVADGDVLYTRALR